MGEDHTELFKIEFTGHVSDLADDITEQSGVESVSVGGHGHGEVDTTIDCEISYDPRVTDRTRLKTDMEAISSVGEVNFG